MHGSKVNRAIGAVLFSLLIGSVLAFVGFFAGAYLGNRFGSPSHDGDDVQAYFWGISVAMIAWLVATLILSYKLWPRDQSSPPLS